MKEEWRTIPGFYRYEVSNLGGVRRKSYRLTGKPRNLKVQIDKDGYRKIGLYSDIGNKPMRKGIARLILEAFVGPCCHGQHAAHLNGLRWDDRLDNLKWCSPKENIDHKISHGTARFGDNHPRSKLNSKDILAIRESSQTSSYLSILYGVCDSHICDIKNRKVWKHL